MTSERGSLSLEMCLLIPVLLLVMVFIAGAAALVRASSDLDDAAWEAARSASLSRSGADAAIAARQALERRLSGERWSCGNQTINVDTSRFQPGGMVAVEVTCTVRVAKAGLFLLGSTDLRSRAAEPLERFRAVR